MIFESSFFQFLLKPLFVRTSELKFKDFFEKGSNDNLRKFQENAILSDEKVIVVKAPTGSGKTVLSVLPLKDEKIEQVLCMYPTRELIYDQAASISEILYNRAGFKPSIIPRSAWERSLKARKNIILFDDADINIVIITSETLSEAMYEYNVHNKSEALKEILRNTSKNKRIVLTTPDVVFMLIQGFYAPMHINNLIVSKSVVFFDEFHVWSDQSLSNALFLLSYLSSLPTMVDKVYIASATLNDELKELIKSSINVQCKIIDEKPSVSGVQIKRKSWVKFINGGDNFVSLQNNMTEKILNIIETLSFLELNKPFAILVDRVRDAYKLWKEVKEKYRGKIKVSLKTGLPLSKKSWEHIEGEGLDVIIGNTAFELGIDMPKLVNGIIFAKFYDSLIQRIGRIGRCKDATEEESNLIILTTKTKFEILKNEIGNIQGSFSIDLDELCNILEKAYFESPKLISYVKSKESLIPIRYQLNISKKIISQGLEEAEEFASKLLQSIKRRVGNSDLDLYQNGNWEKQFKNNKRFKWFEKFRPSSLQIPFLQYDEKVVKVALYSVKHILENFDFEILDSSSKKMKEFIKRDDVKEVISEYRKIYDVPGNSIYLVLCKDVMDEKREVSVEIPPEIDEGLLNEMDINLISFQASKDDTLVKKLMDRILSEVKPPVYRLKNAGRYRDLLDLLTTTRDIYRDNQSGYLALGDSVLLLMWIKRMIST